MESLGQSSNQQNYFELHRVLQRSLYLEQFSSYEFISRMLSTCRVLQFNCNMFCCTYTVYIFRENKELKTKQAKISVETVKQVMTDKGIKNKAERER